MTDADIMDIVTMLRGPDRLEPYLCAAAAEDIERMRKELDELRRLYCNTISSVTQTYAEGNRKTPNQVATEMRWNCFGENINA